MNSEGLEFVNRSSIVLGIPISQTMWFNSPTERKFNYGFNVQAGFDLDLVVHSFGTYCDGIQGNLMNELNVFPKAQNYKTVVPSLLAGVPFQYQLKNENRICFTPFIDLNSIMQRGILNNNIDFRLMLQYGFKTK